jgi:hypothetical protein
MKMVMIDMRGKKINRWTVISFDHFDNRGEAYWLCKCDCGNLKCVAGYTLRKKTSQGCIKCREIHRLGLRYRIEGKIAIFKTRRNIEFIVDASKAKKVCKYSWCLGSHGYMVAHINNKVTSLHRFLFEDYDGKYIDHVNGEKLDNRLNNLKFANDFQNAHNLNINTRNKSGYKGVFYLKDEKKWRVNITAYKKQYYLGTFDDKLEAALAYNESAKKLHGKFACLNPVGNIEGYRVITERNDKGEKSELLSFGFGDV